MIFYGCKLLQCLLLFVVVLIGVSSVIALNQDAYLYHIPEAEGVIIDYEAANPDTESPDFIYGKDQGARVVEFYAP